MIHGRLISSSAGSGVTGLGEVTNTGTLTEDCIVIGNGGADVTVSAATCNEAGDIGGVGIITANTFDGRAGTTNYFSRSGGKGWGSENASLQYTDGTRTLSLDGPSSVASSNKIVTFPDATGTVALVGAQMIHGYRALGDAGTTLLPATDCVLTFAPSGDTRTLTLASATAGQHFFVKNLTGSADNVDFTGGNIDGAAASAYGPIGSGVGVHLVCIGTTDFITV